MRGLVMLVLDTNTIMDVVKPGGVQWGGPQLGAWSVLEAMRQQLGATLLIPREVLLIGILLRDRRRILCCWQGCIAFSQTRPAS